jgi:two-component system, chemotaxis family, response regulator Rcp1
MNERHHILCVEDNMADLGLLMEAFVELDLKHHLHHVIDGEGAMSFLRREGQYEAEPRPQLLLLDLNLPRKSGFEVLFELSRDPSWRSLEIAVLTTTARESDVKRAAGDLHVHFITKPMDFDAFVDVVRRIDGIVCEAGRRGIGAS